MIKDGKKNIKRKLWNNMGSENKKLIIPYRYMPFDIGTSISDALENKLIKYFNDNHYKLIDDTQLLTAFSKYYLFGYKLSDDVSVYIYSFGVGVFLFKGDAFDAGLNYKVYLDCCASCGGKKQHDSAVVVMERVFGKNHLNNSER